jgi:hypothetical protein
MKAVSTTFLFIALFPLLAQAKDERALTRQAEHRTERTQPTVQDENGYQVTPRNNVEANRFINNIEERRELDRQIRDEQRNTGKRRALDN